MIVSGDLLSSEMSCRSTLLLNKADNQKLVDLLTLTEFSASSIYDNPVVFMAGGRGSRLRPYTNDCPKPMLPIGNKPILEILLEQFIESGFRNFFFSVNYLKDIIKEYFKDGKQWGVSISYLEETQPLGTAGSLRYLGVESPLPILVTNADVLSRLDPAHLLQYHLEHESIATMCVREYYQEVPFGVVKTDGTRFVQLLEKPATKYLVNAGVYCLSPDVLPYIPLDTYCDMPDLLSQLTSLNHPVSVFPIHEYWLDIGRPETLREATITWEESRSFQGE